jgi:hypothetical protein
MKMTRLMIPIMAIALATLAACTGCTNNPTKTAATAAPDNKADTIAFAIYAQYVIVEELAADIKEAPGTPQAVKDALKAASLASAPAAESLKDGADTLNGIRAVIAAGQECGPPKPDGKKLCAADFPAKLAELNSLLTDTAPKLKRLTDAYSASKRITR